LDLASLAGLTVALFGMVGGLLLEGGEMKDISQFTAALIVIGGTVGATLVSYPMSVVGRAAKQLGSVLFEQTANTGLLVGQLIGLANKARKQGVVALEQEADLIEDPFLRKALNLAVDGTDLQEVRKMLELEIAQQEQRAEAEAKVFDAAGGYAPTIGIIGAVM